MYRTALRSSPSAAGLRAAIRPTTTQIAVSGSGRRFASTGRAAKKGTWKGTTVRWGLAISALYFYNTSPIFNDEVQAQTISAPPQFSDSDLPTIDAVIEKKRRQALAVAPPPAPQEEKAKEEEPAASPEPTPAESKPEVESESAAAPSSDDAAATPAAEFEPGSPEALEHEVNQQGAYNPETGEINWDCPCLGGMAHGPCGEEFKAAFSCFVYSNEEPKGMDCIDKFQHMQDCFRQHPEVYAEELKDDDEDASAAPAPVPAEDAEAPLTKDLAETPAPTTPAVEEPKKEIKKEEPVSEVIPLAATDATTANEEKKQ